MSERTRAENKAEMADYLIGQYKTRAASELAAPRGSAGCEWTKEGTNEWYQSDCGYSFDFLDEGPMESGFHFCPFCGRRLVAETAKSPNAHRERPAEGGAE